MTVIIGSDVDGKRLKEVVKAFLKENNHEVVDDRRQGCRLC